MIWLFFLFIIILCVVYAQKFKDPIPVLLGPDNIEVGLLHTISFPHKGIFQVPNLSLGRYEGILPLPEEGNRIVIDKSNITINQNMYLVPTSYISGNNIVELNGDRNTTCIVRNSSWTCNNVLSQPKSILSGLGSGDQSNCSDNPGGNDVATGALVMKIIGSILGKIKDCEVCGTIGSLLDVGSSGLASFLKLFNIEDQAKTTELFSCAFKTEIYNLVLDALLANEQALIAQGLDKTIQNLQDAMTNYNQFKLNYAQLYQEITPLIVSDPLILGIDLANDQLLRQTLYNNLYNLQTQYFINNTSSYGVFGNLFDFISHITTQTSLWPFTGTTTTIEVAYKSNMYPFTQSFDYSDSVPIYTYTPIVPSWTTYSQSNWGQMPYIWKSIPFIASALTQYSSLLQEMAIVNPTIRTISAGPEVLIPNPWFMSNLGSPNAFEGLYINMGAPTSIHIPDNTTYSLNALNALTDIWNDAKTLYGRNITMLFIQELDNTFPSACNNGYIYQFPFLFDNNTTTTDPMRQWNPSALVNSVNIANSNTYNTPINFAGECDGFLGPFSYCGVGKNCGIDSTIYGGDSVFIPQIPTFSVNSAPITKPIILYVGTNSNLTCTCDYIIDRIKDFNLENGDIDSVLTSLWMKHGFAYTPMYNGRYENIARSMSATFTQTHHFQASTGDYPDKNSYAPLPNTNVVCGFNSTDGFNWTFSNNYIRTPPYLPNPNLTMSHVDTYSTLQFTTQFTSQSRWFNSSGVSAFLPVSLGTFFGVQNGDVFGNFYEIDNFTGNISVTLNCMVNSITGSLSSLQIPRTQFYANLSNQDIVGGDNFVGPVEIASSPFLCNNDNHERIIDSQYPDINVTLTIDTVTTSGYEYIYLTDLETSMENQLGCPGESILPCNLSFININTNIVLFDLTNCPFIIGQSQLDCQLLQPALWGPGTDLTVDFSVVLQNQSLYPMIVTYNPPSTSCTSYNADSIYEQPKELVLIKPNTNWKFTYALDQLVTGINNDGAQTGVSQIPLQLNTFIPFDNSSVFGSLLSTQTGSFYELSINDMFSDNYINRNIFIDAPSDGGIIIFATTALTKSSQFVLKPLGTSKPINAIVAANSNFITLDLETTYNFTYAHSNNVWSIVPSTANIYTNSQAPYPFDDPSCAALTESACSYVTYFNKTLGTQSVTEPLIEDYGAMTVPSNGIRVFYSYLRENSQWVGDFSSQSGGLNYFTPYCSNTWCNSTFMRKVGSGFQPSTEINNFTQLLGAPSIDCLTLSSPPLTLTANASRLV